MKRWMTRPVNDIYALDNEDLLARSSSIHSFDNTI